MDKVQLQELIERMKERDIRLSLAESITAGNAISNLADIPGISDVLLGGVISYHRETKEDILEVPSALIDEKSAESAEVTQSMCEGLQRLFNSEMTVAVTGAASEPSPQSGYKLKVPVGTVFVYLLFRNKPHTYEVKFEGSPDKIRSQTVDFIYQKIREVLDHEA